VISLYNPTKAMVVAHKQRTSSLRVFVFLFTHPCIVNFSQ
jgi:hypothetical protein